MPRFPKVHSNHAGHGLFSPDEIRRLMCAECARARRYEHALTLTAIGVDRLEQLGDLYGIESRVNILSELIALIRSSIRESDLLGWDADNLLVALFPHTPKEAGASIARRLLERSRRLVFDEGYSSVQITLSLGVAHCPAGGEPELDTLIDQARQAWERAVTLGGNRFFVHVLPPPPKAPEPTPAPAPAPAAAPAPTVSLAGSQPVVDVAQLSRALEQVLSQRVKELFESMGEKVPDFGGREREVLELAMRKLETEKARRESEYKSQIDMLERRLSKLAQSLELTEEELRRVMAAKSIDPGVASIYRTVQGLNMEEADAGLKKEMMSKIFEANVELRKQLGGSGAG